MPIEPEPIVYIIIGAIIGFGFSFFGEELRRRRTERSETKRERIQQYKTLQSWLFRFENRLSGFEEMVKTGGEDMPAFQNELKWFADRINENLTSVARDISVDIYTEAIDLTKEIWKLGQLPVSKQEKFIETADKLWETAQNIIETIDKETENL